MDEDDNPIFSLEYLKEWKHEAKYGDIVSGAAANNRLFTGRYFSISNVNECCYLGTDNGTIITFSIMEEKATVNRCPGLSKTEGVHSLFVDPTGFHILISTTHGNCYYVTYGSKKFHYIRKLGHAKISSVAWNKSAVIRDKATLSNTPRKVKGRCSEAVLLGTEDGGIYELVLEDGKDKMLKLLWTITEQKSFPTSEASAAIQGLVVEPCRGATDYYFVGAATSSRFYTFHGGPSFEDVFRTAGAKGNGGFQELPSKLEKSALVFGYAEYPIGTPIGLGWLTGPGVFHGRVQLDRREGSLFQNDGLIEYPIAPETANKKIGRIFGAKTNSKSPISLAMSRYHFLLLYPNRLCCVHTLSKTVSFDETLSTSDMSRIGFFCQIAADMLHGTFWAFCSKGVFEITVQDDESADAWRLLAQLNRFEEALECAGGNKKRVEEILAYQASQLFHHERYEEAAELYAQVPRIYNFSEVAVKFATKRIIRPLITYIRRRLESTQPEKLTQNTMMATWVVQLYLGILTKMESTTKDQGNQSKKVKKELMEFMRDYDDCIDKNTAFQLINSHGLLDVLEAYAEQKEEREWLMQLFVERHLYRRALLVLAKYVSKMMKKKNRRKMFDADLFYKYTGILLIHEPEKMVDILLGIEPGLVSPARLIPAFGSYNVWLQDQRHKAKIRVSSHPSRSKDNMAPATREDSKNATDPSSIRSISSRSSSREDARIARNHAIRYYQAVIVRDQEADRAVHNFMISLCAAEPTYEAMDQYLFHFLHNPRPPLFDYHHALHHCQKFNKRRTIVEIHQAFGNVSAAAEAAISLDRKLAYTLLRQMGQGVTRRARCATLVSAETFAAVQNDPTTALVSPRKTSEGREAPVLSIETERRLWLMLVQATLESKPESKAVTEALGMLRKSPLEFPDIVRLRIFAT